MKRVLLPVVCILVSASMATAQNQPTVLRVTTLFDGKGHILHDTAIVIENGKIVGLNPHAAGRTYDLRGLTVMPGWIDSHVHISWHFGQDGKNAGQGVGKDESPEHAYLVIAGTPGIRSWAGSRPCKASARKRTRRCATPSITAKLSGRGF